MSQDFVIGLGTNTLWVALKIGAPLMVATLVVGLLISTLQAMTQINETSLSFVPKALASAAALVFFGPWMLNTLVTYTAAIFNSLPTAAR